MRKLFIIPGMGGTGDCWPHLLTSMLQTEFCLETPSLPLTGSSIGEYAEELMPSEPVDLLVGFSMGSAVIQEMLARNPGIASRAVLMAPPAGNILPGPPDSAYDFSGGRGKWSAAMLEMMFTTEWLAAHPDVSEYFPRMKNTVPCESLSYQSRAIREWPGCGELLSQIDIPVLLMAGIYDMITPVVHARTIHSLLPESRLEVFETGHGFPWQCPLETGSLIMEFAI